ncbi:MAG: tRNA (adenosine(37)-N6)-threonylcarbamoyltransferase complex dimerization subunit type 1 TsaB [Pseudomonadota bacterium]
MSDAPYILVFDTSAAHCAAALFRGTDCLAEQVEPMARGQAERLMPLLEEVLKRGGIAWRDLDALAVLTGPGNFTGIRISVAAARGLSMGLGIPSVGVTLFDALRYGMPEGGVVVLTARGDDLAWQMERGQDPQIGTPADFAEAARGVAHVRGHDAEPLARSVGAPSWDATVQPPLAAVAAAALRTLGPDVPPAAPFYLRPADAAVPSDPPPRILP